MLNFILDNEDFHGDLVPPGANQSGATTSKGGITATILPLGKSLWSPSNAFRLVFQRDFNLVLYAMTNPPSNVWTQGTPFAPPAYEDSAVYTALWASGTQGDQSVNQVAMQSDGNLVVYAGTVPQWASGTNGNEGAFLRLQDDGNLVIYSSTGSALWATGTQARS